MRIALKITLAITALLVVVLGVEAWLRGQREAAVYEQDIRREHAVLGRTLEQSVERAWARWGLAEAAALLQSSDSGDEELSLRLVDETNATLIIGEHGGADAWAGDRPLQVSEPKVLRTYLRVDGPQGEWRALELSTSLRGEAAHVRTALQSFAGVAALLMAAASIAGLWLGRSLVGRRVDRLVRHAHQIGGGDFSTLPTDEAHDELGQLSGAVNDMARALARAHEALEEEARARFAITAHLRRSDRLATVGTLSAGLAHELGTPLHVIAGRARMLRSSPALGEAEHQHAEAIVDQSQRVERIIRDLLDFARPRRSERRPVDLEALVRSDLALLEPLLRRRGIEADLGVQPPVFPPGIVHGDADQLRQVFTNLLLNAAQSMPEGGRIRVEIAPGRRAPEEGVLAPDGSSRPAAHDRYTRVVIRDHGEGIEADSIPHLFDPFFTTKRVGEGTGLGLAVAHGIISEHRGWIAVESTPGQGSTFVVGLPEALDTAPAAGDNDARDSA